MQKTLDNVWKGLQILVVVVALGMFAQRAASGAGMEARVAAVERQSAETAQLTKQTAEILARVQERLMSHEIEDAAYNAEIKRLSDRAGGR